MDTTSAPFTDEAAPKIKTANQTRKILFTAQVEQDLSHVIYDYSHWLVLSPNRKRDRSGIDA
jgi:hypothetical protein